ncbi:FHA domain-containing protein [Anabaenopsis arnoldii]|uniref:FHA domain-containing protein n=2 Tax=Anabaenopsis TaxID=110103 RepID=A0ABT5ATN2_9CYAN|nr:FHA domain-containing protein [Anabaenopsis arnoldii]MDB9540679.1 FHA domain-containing protein [Anabaenopsis arnoldii]MDH6093117.1 FHA domain-containing protein [Anabaenopsis arnoldii]
MIVCPNCNHPNPDGAVQCEACYTPLPTIGHCPNCGATVQADAAFCGQCGYNLHSNGAATPASVAIPNIPVEVPQLVQPDPPLEVSQPDALGTNPDPNTNQPVISPLPPTIISTAVPEPAPVVPEPAPVVPAPAPVVPAPAPVVPAPAPVVTAPAPVVTAPAPAPVPYPSMTQLQQVTARLFHVQSDREIELPQGLSVIHIGKPNDRIPPDIDVSGFSNSEIVSRIHADIRVEGDFHYIEDVGSSNGTYINNSPLLPGNRHRLRPGDRISLGKGDLVTFLFQLA